MTAIHPQPCRDGPGELRHSVALEALSETGEWILTTLREWRRRSRDRAQLVTLDERMLRDVGLTHGDREFLSSKPFWRK